MKILVERDSVEEPKAGDIVQTNIGVCMKIYTGYVSLEGDNVGELNCDCDIKVSKVLIKSEDVVISKTKEIEGDNVVKYKERDDDVIIYKDGLYLSEDFIKFLGKVSCNSVKEIFKVDDSLMKDSLGDLLFSIYSIYYNHRDKVNDEEFMANELKNMIYDFFNPNNEKAKRTDGTLLDCINCFKNIKKENLLNVYCNISMIQYHGSLEEITYYFNKIGRLVEIGRIEYLNDN